MKTLETPKTKVTILLFNTSKQADTIELFNKRNGPFLYEIDSNIPSGIRVNIVTQDIQDKYEQSYEEFFSNLLEHGDIIVKDFRTSLPDKVILFQRDLIKKRIYYDYGATTEGSFAIFDKFVMQAKLEAKEKMEISFIIEAEEDKNKYFNPL